MIFEKKISMKSIYNSLKPQNALLLLICFTIAFLKSNGQCNNTTPFASATAPVQGATVQISSCNYGGEFATLNAVVSGRTYSSTSNINTDFITIRQGSANGPVVAFGITPLIWTAPANGTYFMHINTNAVCGTAAVCRVTALGCFNANGAGTCTNSIAFGTMAAPMPGSSVQVSCQYAGEYATVNSIVSGATYSSSSSIPTDVITVRSGSFNGPIVAAGISPLIWTAQSAVNHFIHITTNTLCGTSNICRNNILSRQGQAPCSGMPNAGIVSISNSTACPSATVLLSTSGLSSGSGLSLQWQSSNSAFGPFLNIPNANSFSLITNSQNTIFYRIVSTCSNSALSNTSAVISLSIATPTIIAQSGSICPGSPFVIIPNGASTYTYFTPGQSTVSGSSLTVSPLNSTNYTITGTGANGCLTNSNSQALVSVNLLPSPTISILSSTNAVCFGNTLTLTVSGANSYTWTNLNSNASNLIFTPLSSGIYTVSGTGTAICNGVNTISLTVFPLPTISVSNATVCSGYAFTLQPQGASNYSYSNGASVITPLSNTVVTISGTSSNGCISSNTVASNISVIPSPTLSVNNGTICFGKAFFLNYSGASTYSVNGIQNITGSITPLQTSTFSIIGTATNGCVSLLPAISQITVFANPTVAVTSTNEICYGETTTLTANGALTYTWGDLQTGSLSIVSPSVSSAYTVTGTSLNSCTHSAVFNVAVKPIPNLILSSSQNPFCSNQMGTLYASGAHTYTWSTGSFNQATTITPSQNQYYSVWATNTVNCKSKDSILVSVFVPTVLITGPSTICSGQTAILSASPSALSYSWSNQWFGPVNTVAPPSHTVFALTVSSISNNIICSGTPTTFTLNVLNTPVISASISSQNVCKNQNFVLTASGASNYTWSTGSTLQTLTKAETNPGIYTYSVIASGTNGCVSNAVTLHLRVNGCVGLNETVVQNVRLFPNPNSGLFFLEIDATEPASIEITDISGKTLLQTYSNDFINTIDIQNLKPGLYLCIVKQRDSQTQIKFVKY
jgi:hypothetical protein